MKTFSAARSVTKENTGCFLVLAAAASRRVVCVFDALQLSIFYNLQKIEANLGFVLTRSQPLT